MNVLILGYGLAGQIINEILTRNQTNWGLSGINVLERNSTDTLEPNAGLYYVHQRIPMFDLKPVTVKYSVDSDTDVNVSRMGYARKVYRDPSVPVSLREGTDTGYTLEGKKYHHPNVHYNQAVETVRYDLHNVTTEKGYTWHYDLLISTIPATVFLKLLEPRVPLLEINLWNRPVYIIEKAGGHPEQIQVKYLPDQFTAYYRSTEWQGKLVLESLAKHREYSHKLYPGKIKVHPEMVHIREFLWSEANIQLRGRYGAWVPKRLTHHVYENIKHGLRNYDPNTE